MISSNFLRGRDAELQTLIHSIQHEELGHLNYAEERIAMKAAWTRALKAMIAGTTGAVIWLSTWGESSRMAQDLRAARAARAVQ